MHALLEDRGMAERLGAAGREAALGRFGMERFAREWEELFGELVDRPGSRGRQEAA
jgi:hypothetical protein